MRPVLPSNYGGQRNREQVDFQNHKILRGNTSFGDGVNTDNIDGVWATATSPGTANTQFTVNHTLQRIPVGFDVKKKDAACDVYAGITAWTTTQIFLKATGINVHLTLFIH